jgi:alkaline phosphatase D
VTITRRGLLRGVAVGTAGLALGACGGDPAVGGDAGPSPDAPIDAPPIPIDPPERVAEVAAFPLGVSAGDLVGTRGLLWTRYAGAAVLACVAWRVEGDAYVEELAQVTATPADGGFVHVAIEGLVPGARYRYAFFETADGARTGRSRIGSFRAPIADDAIEPLTFGAISCTKDSHATDPIQRAADHGGLDAFLFLGDNVYADGATDPTSYRTKYEEHYGRPAHVALRAATGQYITWDDHEIVNDFNPETLDADHTAAAFGAFFEHNPCAKVAGDERRIWRSARWGRTLEVFVLDTRSERLPSTRTGANAQYISPAQLAWLEAGLAASPCVFKVIMNSVPITNMPLVWDAAKSGRWEGYEAQRTALLRHIDDNAIAGVTWLSGDFHLAFISHVGTAGQPGANQREILAGPGGQSSNPLVGTLNQPQFSFASGTNNFTTLQFDPAARSITVTYIDGDGQPFHSSTLAM